MKYKKRNDKKSAEIGYDLSPKFQRRGLMNEALKSVLKFGFKNLKLKAIKAFTHKENVSSKKLLERNNFKLIQGRIDEHNKDNIIYEIKKSTADYGYNLLLFFTIPKYKL